MALRSGGAPGPVHRATLDNGLGVLVQEEHTAPLVSVWCWYKVGSKDERPGETGISHWVEHMNFKGTANISRDEIKGIVERFGGTWNGYTWIDQTAYFETAAGGALDRMLFVEAERMVSCLYHPDDCESERTVIIAELEGGENDPEQLLDQEVTAIAFVTHPYRHPTIGWLADLRAMTREDLYAHYRHYYVPNNATLVIVGDVEAGDALRRVEHFFGGIPRGPDVVRAPIVEPAQRGERRTTVRRPGTTAYLKVAYRAPSAGDADFLPALVLDAALTGAKGLNLWSSFRGSPSNRSARLYRALVERGLASAVSGALVPTEQPFLYTVSATATDGTPLTSVETALFEEIDRVVHDGITATELVRAKTQLMARLVFEGDSVTDVAHQLGYFETIGAPGVYADVNAGIAAVSVDDVARAARRLLPESNRTVGWFEPTRVAPHPAAGADHEIPKER